MTFSAARGEPTYPTIPHISLSLLRGLHLIAELLGVPVAILLTRPAYAEGVGRHVLGERRARRDVGTSADAEGRHQGAVRADEHAIADHRLVFGDAVVVAGDGAGSNVHTA